jgi:short-subunit dehydrogenase
MGNASAFKDKVIWITGASSGIGESVTLELAKQGARLVISARGEETLQKLALKTALGPRDILVLPFDLADTSKASGYAAEVMNHFGRIDALVNNGGFSQRSEATDTSETTERQIMEVNYFAHVALSKAVLPYMLRQKSGKIVVISSIAGKFGFYSRSSYSAAKHALHGYFESLRLETENKGIKVLMVCPGIIKTPISFNAIGKDGAKYNQPDPRHEKAMSAEECARQIMDAMKSDREEVLIGGKEINMIWIRKFFPGLFGKILRRQKPQM